MNGTAVCGERVLVVQVGNGRVSLTRGRISDVRADDRTETVVLDDRQFLRPDEGYERSFRMDDIHLLKEQEAKALEDPSATQDWFGTIYQDRLVAKIHRALKRLNGRSAHQPA
jgi:hypothetical protein